MLDTKYPFMPRTVAGQLVAALIEQSKSDPVYSILPLIKGALDYDPQNEYLYACNAEEMRELVGIAEYLNQERLEGGRKDGGGLYTARWAKDFVEELTTE